MAFDIKLFSEKLTRLIEMQEYTKEEFSLKSKISLDRLTKILNSELEPTGDEVLIMADILKSDYYFLISNESVAQIEKCEMFYRSNKGLISKEDKRMIAETLILASFYKYLDDFSTRVKRTFKPIITEPLHVNQGVEVALQLRSFFSLSDREKGINPFELARELGIQIYRRNLSNSAVSGIHLFSEETGKIILINYSDDIYRQNFTLLHELAHSIFDVNDDYRLSLENVKNNNELKYVEMRANRFASTFLIPPSLAKIIKSKYKSDADFIEIANDFNINPQALAYALNNSALIDYNTLKRLEKLKIETEKKTDPELSGLSKKTVERVRLLQEKGISLNYFRKCLEAYNNELISFSRLSEVLGLTDIELNSYLEIMGVQHYDR